MGRFLLQNGYFITKWALTDVCSEYVRSLPPDVRKRYCEKTVVIGCDPLPSQVATRQFLGRDKLFNIQPFAVHQRTVEKIQVSGRLQIDIVYETFNK